MNKIGSSLLTSVAAVVAFSGSALAAPSTITIFSSATPSIGATTTSLGSINNVTPNPAWALIGLDGSVFQPNGTGVNSANVAAVGLSCATSGGCANWVSPDTTEVPDPQIPNNTFVDFVHTFMIDDPQILSARLQVLADDRAQIFVNDVSIFATPVGSANGPCNLAVIGCITANRGDSSLNHYDFKSSLLAQQLNKLTIRVTQTNAGGFGAAYLATITTVPEPGFYGLVSAGLAGLLFAYQRRRRTIASN